MMYRCENCGHLFEEGEQAVWEERHGFDAPPYEKWSGCPLCHGDYEETKPCKKCGAEHTDDELIEGVCEECISGYRYNVDTCYEIGATNDTEICINSFLATYFTKEEIEELLIKEIKKSEKTMPFDCQKFIEFDKEWFVYELILKEEKENENQD